MMYSMAWKGILLGLGAAAPIGPVNVEIARRSLRGGWRAGMMLGCGAVSVDVTYAVLYTVSVGPMIDRAWIRTGLGVAGIALLTYMGVMCLASARQQMESALAAVEADRPVTRNYVTGVLMTSLNPMTLAFWFVAVPSLAGQLSGNPSRDLPFLCMGVFLGALSWVVFFASLMSLAGRVAKRTTVLLADLLGGLMLLGFAGYAGWHLVKG